MSQFNKTTPAGKGVRTALQAVVGALVGLVAVVWAVPGVPEAVQAYLVTNAIPLLLLVGVPAGVVAFLQNHFEQKRG
jgi:small basic protein